MLFGHGKFNVGVENGEVNIRPNEMRGSGALGRGATTPETLMAMLEGRITPLEAYFKVDLVARAESAELHRVYNYFLRFADATMRSQRLQSLLEKFRETLHGKQSAGGRTGHAGHTKA